MFGERGIRLLAGLLVVFTLAAGVACGSNKSQEELAGEALQRGLLAHKAGNVDEAVADYREALAHDPRNKYAFYNLGLIDQTRGNLQGAETNYRNAMSADPNFTPALFNLAIVRTKVGAYEEAISLYRQVVSLAPDDAAAHLNLGFVLKQTGKVKAGNTELSRAVKLDPQLAERIPSTSASAANRPTPSQSPGN